MEQLAYPWQMWFALVVVFGAIVGYSSDRFSLETVSGVVLSLLLVVFQAFPVVSPTGEVLLGTSELLAGFASPALFAIIGLLIIGQGMYQSGALEYPTRVLISAYDRYRQFAVIGVFLFVMVVSAFLNNTPVVVMFVPIMAAIAAQGKISPSRLMMPLSFVSILGGMTTTIGSSTNLLAVAEYEVVTGERLGFFALAPMGLTLAAAGALYLAVVTKFFLPDRRGGPVEGPADGRQFVAQLTLERGNPLIGQTSKAGLFPDLPNVTVRMIQRRDEVLLPPFDDVTLRLHDKVIVAATRQAVTDLLKSRPAILAGFMAEVEIGDGTEGELTMVEAVVAPGSRIIGRTISQIRFRFQTKCVIIGIERRSRMIRTEVAHIRLEAGDVLLILGDRSDVRSLRNDRDILMLERSMTQLPDPDHARYAGIIFVAVVGAAASGIMPIAVAAILGATGMVATGCLNVRQAARAVDRRIYLLIGVALALGAALDQTGGAEYLAGFLTPLADPDRGGVTLLIAAFFGLTAGLTNLLSNNATVVLFTPIAVSAAEAAGIEPLVLVLTVIYAANCSFATPVAYQTNLLVMAPGHYQFRDFVVVGAPLIILLWVVYTLAAPAYFRAVGLL
jgi:di/tricarboxylate transporter